MKKKYLFFFLAAFICCAAWNMIIDLPDHPVRAAQSEERILSSLPDLGVTSRLRPYFQFREAMEDHLKTIPSYAAIGSLPKSLRQAVVATEDRRFYEHGAIDPIGILRAVIVNFNSGETIEGGSSISQQVVKNIFLTQDRTLTRKAQELVLSILLERNYSKDEILEIYLNTAYFGANATGIEEASRTYFNKKPDDLTLAQSSMLAGLLQAPSYYNPLENYRAAKERQKIVLTLMHEQGLISETQERQAESENLGF